MHPDMFQPLLIMIIGFYLFYVTALIVSMRAEIIFRERNTSWVKELALNLKDKRPI